MKNKKMLAILAIGIAVYSNYMQSMHRSNQPSQANDPALDRTRLEKQINSLNKRIEKLDTQITTYQEQAQQASTDAAKQQWSRKLDRTQALKNSLVSMRNRLQTTLQRLG